MFHSATRFLIGCGLLLGTVTLVPLSITVVSANPLRPAFPARAPVVPMPAQTQSQPSSPTQASGGFAVQNNVGHNPANNGFPVPIGGYGYPGYYGYGYGSPYGNPSYGTIVQWGTGFGAPSGIQFGSTQFNGGIYQFGTNTSYNDFSGGGFQFNGGFGMNGGMPFGGGNTNFSGSANMSFSGGGNLSFSGGGNLNFSGGGFNANPGFGNKLSFNGFSGL